MDFTQHGLKSERSLGTPPKLDGNGWTGTLARLE
jgi:hypothetical protein